MAQWLRAFTVLQRTWVQYPAPIWWLTIICNSSSREANTLFCLLDVAGGELIGPDLVGGVHQQIAVQHGVDELAHQGQGEGKAGVFLHIGCGPVFPTKSKPDADTAIGINRLERLNMISERPVVAIGGIDEENMKVVHDTGVAGLAVISLVFDSKDLAATVKKMKNLYK